MQKVPKTAKTSEEIGEKYIPISLVMETATITASKRDFFQLIHLF